MQKSSKIQFLLVIAISVLVGYYIGVNKINFEWKNYRPVITVESKEPPPEVRNADFSRFWNVWQKIEGSYYDKSKLDPEKMINGAISGMLGSLEDPFTVYLPPVQNENFKQGLAGQFQGIGAELGLKDQRITVIAPLNGSPAQKSGVRAGDTILAVDGTSTANWTISQAVEKIRGPKGTKVTLSILHKDETQPQDIDIIRDVITVESVEYFVKKVSEIDSVEVDKSYNGFEIAYISLSQFGDTTNPGWLDKVNKLSLELNNNKNVKGLILDLRNNPGGYLSDAVFISSEFIKENATVVIEEEGGGQQNVLKSNRRGLLLDIPVIVLVNKGSASASEIVAAALRDNNRATIVGETSFGKGTIQQSEDLGGGAGIHITIAKWLTPNKEWINEKGIIPDIEIALDPKNPDRDLQLEKAILELVK